MFQGVYEVCGEIKRFLPRFNTLFASRSSEKCVQQPVCSAVPLEHGTSLWCEQNQQITDSLGVFLMTADSLQTRRISLGWQERMEPLIEDTQDGVT